MTKRRALTALLGSALTVIVAGCGGEPEMRGAWAAKSTGVSNVTYEGADLSARLDWRPGTTVRYWWELSSDGGSTWTRATRVRAAGPAASAGGAVTITDKLRPRCPASSTGCSAYRLRAAQTYGYRVCAGLRGPKVARDACSGARRGDSGARRGSFTTPPAPLFSGDFETGDSSQFSNVQCLKERLTVGEGPPASLFDGQWARFEVRAGDREPQTGYEGRCEALPGLDVKDGEEVWQRFSVQFAPGLSTGNYLQFAQWHASGGDGQAALAFRVEGGSNRMVVAHGGGTKRYWTGSELETGRRYDFVAHIKFDDDPTRGFVELWLDGERQTMQGGGGRAYGPTSDPCLGAGCPDPDPSPSVYPKVGIYRSSTDANDVAVYADDILLGSQAGSIGFSP